MSSPLLAAILTRINDERLNAGKKVIGFANLPLCKNPGMFNDITAGDYGYGWEPVTSLGTPKYTEMLAYFKSV